MTDTLAQVAPENINVVALTPAEMVPAQHELIAWCDRKVRALNDEFSELELHQKLAIENGWKTSVVVSNLNRTQRRIAYYEKVKMALEAGYLLVPNMPVDVLAVRVKRAKPREQHDTGWHRFHATAEMLAVGEGRYVNEQPKEREEERQEKRGTETVSITHYFSAEHDEELSFPVALTKPIVLDAVSKAMALRVFDEIGRVQNSGGRDPIYIGRILDPRSTKYNVRLTSFFLAWWVDTAAL